MLLLQIPSKLKFLPLDLLYLQISTKMSRAFLRLPFYLQSQSKKKRAKSTENMAAPTSCKGKLPWCLVS